MKSVEQWLFDKIKDRGITIQFLSDRTGVGYNTLMNCKNYGAKIKAEDFLAVCVAAGINPLEWEEYKKGFNDGEED